MKFAQKMKILNIQIWIIALLWVLPCLAGRTLSFDHMAGVYGNASAPMYAYCNIRISNISSIAQTVTLDLTVGSVDGTVSSTDTPATQNPCVSSLSHTPPNRYTFTLPANNVNCRVIITRHAPVGLGTSAGMTNWPSPPACSGVISIVEDRGAVRGNLSLMSVWSGQYDLSTLALNGGRPF